MVSRCVVSGEVSDGRCDATGNELGRLVAADGKGRKCLAAEWRYEDE